MLDVMEIKSEVIDTGRDQMHQKRTNRTIKSFKIKTMMMFK